MNCTRNISILIFSFIYSAVFSQIGNPATQLNDARLLKLHGWNKPTLSDASKTRMYGLMGTAYQRGVDRLSHNPYTVDWLMSDITFKVKRIFTNYSGDVSGRFIELGSLLSRPNKLYPATTLPEVLQEVSKYQKPDGHFGVDIQTGSLIKTNDKVVTMLWGNARILVGLVTASKKFNDQRLLESAKRLGDFYVNTADWLCNPAREAEYKATGTAADSYLVGYFPAIESLAMLYKETNDKRYLDMAERIAAFFYQFDGLPLNHSHGNLSAWRGILDLYNITGKSGYLQKTIAKWKDAVSRGYVWSIGGVGEHWYVDYRGSEGCSESDWLRLNLDLWKYTGQTSYLDMAERLLENQYIQDQTANGGYGMRHFDVIPDVGPIGTFGGVNEWDFCCSFHGPLGLYFFKEYLASSNGNNIYINFPYSYNTQLTSAGNTWNISSASDSLFNISGEKKVKISVTPAGTSSSGQKLKVYMRMPVWAGSVRVNNQPARKAIDGYFLISDKVSGTSEFTVAFKASPFIESRKFAKELPIVNKISTFKDVSLVLGSELLYEYPARNNSLSNLLVLQGTDGQIKMLKDADGSFASVQMPRLDTDRSKIIEALRTAKKTSLMAWPVPGLRRTAFSYNLVVIPEKMLPASEIKKFTNRIKGAEIPHYGCSLEKKEFLWPNTLPWKFTPTGIHVTGGDVGLIEGGGYKDYKFEFDMVLPTEGEGISGWVVRAQDADNYLMLQIQSSDTKYNDPNVKTTPNSLRIIPKMHGQYIIEEPIVIAKNLVTGKKYHVVTQCVDKNISIFIEGEKVASYNTTLRDGLVGFRVSQPLDQGIFSNICLTKIK